MKITQHQNVLSSWSNLVSIEMTISSEVVKYSKLNHQNTLRNFSKKFNLKNYVNLCRQKNFSTLNYLKYWEQKHDKLKIK